MLVIKINHHLKRAEIVYKRKVDEKFESNRPAIVQTNRETYNFPDLIVTLYIV